MVILQLWIPERGNVERGERKRERGKVKGRGWRVKVAANQRRGRHRPLSSTVSHRRNKETRRGGKLISSCASHFLLDSNNEVYSSSVYRSCDYFLSFFIFYKYYVFLIIAMNFLYLEINRFWIISPLLWETMGFESNRNRYGKQDFSLNRYIYISTIRVRQDFPSIKK